MVKKISPRLTMLCVGLALLLSVACKGKPDKSVMGGAASTTPAASTSQPAQTPAPAAAGSAPAPAAQTAAAAPGGTPAGMPATAGSSAGAPTSGPGSNPGASADEQPLKVEKLPAIVARVNGRPIKKQELIQGAQVMEVQLAQRGRQVVPTAAFYRKVLDELVAITLLQQDAKAQGVTASPQEVQQQIDARKKSFPSEDAYHQALAKAGMTEATLREEAGNQIAVQKYVETKLAANVNISDQTARQFYDRNKSEMTAPERVHLRHIVIQVLPKASEADKAKAKEKAEEVYKKVKAGEDFAKLAAQYSDDPGSKTRGGDIGFIVKGQTVPAFEAAAFALQKPNEVAPLTETRFGYHIIQLLERQPGGEIPFDQVKDRLIGMLKQQQIQQIFQSRAEELRGKAKVEVYI
jgi:peptidyl-prolyl cis-trans isomerase C